MASGRVGYAGRYIGDGYERVGDEWEVVAKPGWDPDLEVVGGEYEAVGEDLEVVGEEFEVVAKPGGDPVLEYLEGLRGSPPAPPSYRWLELATEFYRALRMRREAERRGLRAKARDYAGRARRLARLVYSCCPRLERGGCPLRDPLSRCPLGRDVERRCRALDRRRPRKVRACVKGRR